MAKPTVAREPWYKPSRIVWQLPWLGLVFASITVVAVLVIILGYFTGILGMGWALIISAWLISEILNFVLGVWSNLTYVAALVVVIASAILLFRSSTRSGKHVNFLYKSLPRNRFYLSIALWISLVAFMVFQFIPFTPAYRELLFSINSRYTLQALDLFGGINSGTGIMIEDRIAELSSINIPIIISLGASLTLAYALFMFLLMTTLRPNSALLLKRIFYIFALALATVAPLGIVSSPIWYSLTNISFASSQSALFNLLAPMFLLLIISLVWLSFQRSRLAALGARVKARVRWIAGGRSKTDDLGALRPWLGRIAKAYLVGASQAPFARALEDSIACECLGDLDAALAAAHRDAEPGEVVLLAPAAA